MQQRNRPVKIVVDSAADVPPALAQELDITVIPMRVHLAGTTHLDGVDISGEEFYRRLEATQSVTTTSLPALESFVTAYRRLTGQGYDVVSIHMSSKLSGTFGAALMASTGDGVEPEAISVIDTRTFSMAQGWVAVIAAEAARDGKNQHEVAQIAESLVPCARLYGVLDTLEYVIRSGRIARIPGTVGTMLNVKPILTIEPNGQAAILEKVRSRKKAMERIVELAAQLGPLERLAVMHGADPEGAEQLSRMLQDLHPPEPVIVGHIGAVLGTHLGPAALGVCCITRDA